ncbi:MAG: hypothetical protein LAT77_10475 [Aliidiomarina sp.]|uniref:hypothetical protein n=1 Tax=Aliidiomarina sp. TaxID=1872439 RepID=UPI0025C0D9C1|nr:hypothetical protein [Aliidiomarina sp.]MCH8502320.1 hypothetical protein [Aliidiomarina sp.]
MAEKQTLDVNDEAFQRIQHWVVTTEYDPNSTYLDQRLRDWWYAVGVERDRLAKLIDAKIVASALADQAISFDLDVSSERLRIFIDEAELPVWLKRKVK